MITVRGLKLIDVWREAENIRGADQLECLAGTGSPLEVHMALVWDYLDYKRVALDEGGRLLCAWGVDCGGPLRLGNVWLFATERAVPRAAAIHRHLKVEMESIEAMYPVLECWADSRNTVHHRWLQWLGFREIGEEPYGKMGLPFKHFRKERQCA